MYSAELPPYSSEHEWFCEHLRAVVGPMLPDFPPSNRIIRIFGTSAVSLAGGISLNSPSRVPVNVDSDIAMFPSTCCPSELLGGSSSLVHTVGISLQNNGIGDDTATRRDASSEVHAVVPASLSRVGPARTGFANANRRDGGDLRGRVDCGESERLLLSRRGPVRDDVHEPVADTVVLNTC